MITTPMEGLNCTLHSGGSPGRSLPGTRTTRREELFYDDVQAHRLYEFGRSKTPDFFSDRTS